MKINESQRIGAINQYRQQNEQRAGTAGKKRSQDEVSISAEAKEMLTNSQTQKEERLNRVNDLRKEVASGTYHVAAGKIAEKLWPFIK